jgi:hypothetical protein
VASSSGVWKRCVEVAEAEVSNDAGVLEDGAGTEIVSAECRAAVLDKARRVNP